MQSMMEQMAEQLINIVEPTEEEKNIIMKYIKENNISIFMDNYDELNLSEESKEKIEALKAILDVTSTGE